MLVSRMVVMGRYGVSDEELDSGEMEREKRERIRVQ